MKNNGVKAIAEGAVCAALSTLLMLISLYVPVVSAITSVVCGLPIMFAAVKHGSLTGVCSFAAAAAVAVMLNGDILATGLLSLMYIVPAMAFGICANKKQRYSVSVFITSAFVLAGFVIQLMIVNGDGSGLDKQFGEIAAQAGETFSSMMQQADISQALGNVDINKLMSEAIDMTIYSLKLYMPTIAIAASVCLGYLISVLGVFFMKRLRICNIKYTRFNMIKAPKATLPVFIISFLIINASKGDNLFINAMKNLSVITNIVIAVSGFSFADYMLSKKIRRGYVRAAVYAGILLFGAMMSPLVFEFIVLLGIFDIIGKYRHVEEIGDGESNEKE